MYLWAASYYLAAKQVVVVSAKVGNNATRFLNDDNATCYIPRIEAVLKKAIKAAIGHIRQIDSGTAHAAQATSVDFNYLLAQAEVESAMNPTARAATSSATGLYQFIDSTWLDTVKKHGPRFGLGAVADQINLTPSGNAYVADPAQREMLFDLENLRTALRQQLPAQSAELLTLDKTIANLLRMWARS